MPLSGLSFYLTLWWPLVLHGWMGMKPHPSGTIDWLLVSVAFTALGFAIWWAHRKLLIKRPLS